MTSSVPTPSQLRAEPDTRNAARPRRARRSAARVLEAIGATAAMLISTLAMAAPANAEATVTVAFTGIGIYPRSAPSMAAERVGSALTDGTPVTVVCEDDAEPVFNGSVTITIWDRLSDGTWLPNAFLDTGTDGWTPGVPHCDDWDGVTSSVAESPAAPAPVEPVYDNPCMAMWPGGATTTEEIFGGTRTTHDAEMSQYLVCEGFGAGGVEYSTGMKCAMTAAAVTLTGVDGAGSAASLICDGVALSEQGVGAIPGVVCGILGESLATGTGVAAAGVAAPSGPGAVPVGLGTYRGLSAFMKVSCGALFDGGAYDFGVQLAADHEARVAHDVLNYGKCLRMDDRFGQITWGAADC